MTRQIQLTFLVSFFLLSANKDALADVIVAVDSVAQTLTFQSSDATSVTPTGGFVGWTRSIPGGGSFGSGTEIGTLADFASLNGVGSLARSEAFSLNVGTTNNPRNISVVFAFSSNDSGSLVPGANNIVSYAGLSSLFQTMLEDLAAADTSLSPTFGTGQGNLLLTSSATAAAVPEPSSVAFLSLIGVGFVCRRWRKRSKAV